jgi:hypothetical protein
MNMRLERLTPLRKTLILRLKVIAGNRELDLSENHIRLEYEEDIQFWARRFPKLKEWQQQQAPVYRNIIRVK